MNITSVLLYEINRSQRSKARYALAKYANNFSISDMDSIRIQLGMLSKLTSRTNEITRATEVHLLLNPQCPVKSKPESIVHFIYFFCAICDSLSPENFVQLNLTRNIVPDKDPSNRIPQDKIHRFLRFERYRQAQAPAGSVDSCSDTYRP